MLLTIFKIFFLSLLSFSIGSTVFANESKTEIKDYSSFFDESLNDMQEEADIAKEDGKKGILIMFEMDECPFCARMKNCIKSH